MKKTIVRRIAITYFSLAAAALGLLAASAPVAAHRPVGDFTREATPGMVELEIVNRSSTTATAVRVGTDPMRLHNFGELAPNGRLVSAVEFFDCTPITLHAQAQAILAGDVSTTYGNGTIDPCKASAIVVTLSGPAPGHPGEDPEALVREGRITAVTISAI